MVSTFYEKHPTTQAAIRTVVVAVACGASGKDMDFQAAQQYDYVDVDGDSDNAWSLVLTDKGFEAARRWLRDDSHGGEAA